MGRRVAVLSLGGTITCAPDESGGLVPATDPTADLVLDGVEVRSISWSLTDSTEITVDELVRLAREIRRLADDVDGVVVTQGTDTLEESAFVMSLLRPLDRPVVLTAAMRAPTMPGSDAQANLTAAIRTAVDPGMHRLAAGAVVVMNDQIHSARWVQKAHTQRLDAFSSGEAGVLGVLAEGRALVLSPEPDPVVPPLIDTDTGLPAQVALHSVSLDEDVRVLRAIGDLGLDGLVVEAAGGGHVSGATADVLGEIAERAPVVLASRTRAGAVLRETYGSPGAEIDLIRRGCTPAGLLPALKARLLLVLLLRSGYERAEIEGLLGR